MREKFVVFTEEETRLFKKSYQQTLESEYPRQQTMFVKNFFQRFTKYLHYYKHDSFYLERKYTCIFVFGLYVLLEARSFRKAKTGPILEEIISADK